MTGVTEKQLSATVIKAARTLGWRVAHFVPATIRAGRMITPVAADGAGFPDLVLVKGERLVFAELKQDKAYPKPHQREWLAALSTAGQAVHVWKPKHWHDGSILEVLNG